MSKKVSHLADELSILFPRMTNMLFRTVYKDNRTLDELTVPQMKLLEAVASSSNGLRMSDLASELGVSAATLTGTARRLQDMKVIDRQRSPTDERVVLVQLTAKGRKLVKRHERALHDFYKNILNELTPRERNELVKAHQRIYDAYELVVRRRERVQDGERA